MPLHPGATEPIVWTMFRSLVSTSRRQRFVAFLSVVTLALAVPPAFGAPSVATQVKAALKMAKKADKNATTALNLAKSASKGGEGAKGATGPAGPAGPAGTVGAKGDAGAAGAVGPVGPKGDTGAAGSQGPQGLQGEKGDTGATGAQGAPGADGSSAPALSYGLTSTGALVPAVTFPQGAVPVTPDADGVAIGDVTPLAGKTYVVTAHIALSEAGGSNNTLSCGLFQGDKAFDRAEIKQPYGFADLSLTGVIPASADPSPIVVACSGSDSAGKARLSLTGVAVGS